MKNSIFTIAFALIAFTNVALAGNGNAKREDKTLKVYASDSTVTAPQTLIDGAFSKEMEDVIAEDQKITESTIHEDEPVLRGKTIEEVIAQDNQIIESTIAKDVYPLDFRKIDTKSTVKMGKCNDRLMGSL
jgi:NDP-sugar pyrophosphorylase family protein